MLPDTPFLDEAPDFGSFYANDYLMYRKNRQDLDYAEGHPSHNWDHYRRVLQAFRTETDINAIRYLGAMLHYVEDSCPISHICLPGTYQGKWHGPLESLIHTNGYSIAGYQPRLLGEDEEGMLRGIFARLNVVGVSARERWARIKPLVDAGGDKNRLMDRLDPIILEQAYDTSRLTADVLFTLFTWADKHKGNDGGQLTGTVTASHIPLLDGLGAKVYLVDAATRVATDYETLTEPLPDALSGELWKGRFAFRNLPDGVYLVCANRTASRPVVSDPVVVKRGAAVDIALSLKESEPAGNLVENPDGGFEIYLSGSPDRWRDRSLVAWGGRTNRYWRSSFVRMQTGTVYRCGASLKDPHTKVQFCLFDKPWEMKGLYPLTLSEGQRSGETKVLPTAGCYKMVVEVLADKPLTNVIEKVWVVPEKQLRKMRGE